MSTKNISVRFPAAILDRIRLEAESERRSINSQIVVLIEAALSEREAPAQRLSA